jgi:hypothetical protein
MYTCDENEKQLNLTFSWVESFEMSKNGEVDPWLEMSWRPYFAGTLSKQEYIF